MGWNIGNTGETGLFVGGENIIRDNLIFYLDPGDYNCVPDGTGNDDEITELALGDDGDITSDDDEINDIRKNNPGIKIIAHPECPPDVIKASDFAGSTSGMIKYVKDKQPKKVMMVTECSMSDNVQIDNPKVEFIRPCNLCPHMKKITLPKILDCLENETNELIMDAETLEKARKSVERMAEIGR